MENYQIKTKAQLQAVLDAVKEYYNMHKNLTVSQLLSGATGYARIMRKEQEEKEAEKQVE